MPHDVNGLIQLFGSREAFVREMDRLFTLESDEMQLDVSDVTGLMGQYAHGNEPSHHMAYLYNYVGQPWKTQELTRRLLHEMYAPTPEGIIGNEDCGQMSAWYVLSSLGFYQVEPAGGRYFFGSPLFDKAELRVRDGVFTVIAHNNSAADKYIQRVKLNGEPYAKPYIGFEEIAAGGTLEFEMGPEPAVWYEL